MVLHRNKPGEFEAFIFCNFCFFVYCPSWLWILSYFSWHEQSKNKYKQERSVPDRETDDLEFVVDKEYIDIMMAFSTEIWLSYSIIFKSWNAIISTNVGRTRTRAAGNEKNLYYWSSTIDVLVISWIYIHRS